MVMVDQKPPNAKSEPWPQFIRSSEHREDVKIIFQKNYRTNAVKFAFEANFFQKQVVVLLAAHQPTA